MCGQDVFFYMNQEVAMIEHMWVTVRSCCTATMNNLSDWP